MSAVTDGQAYRRDKRDGRRIRGDRLRTVMIDAAPTDAVAVSAIAVAVAAGAVAVTANAAVAVAEEILSLGEQIIADPRMPAQD